ncbi:hypothetical protein V8G54_015627 [Vigna mungo]|uniref:Uncharacterized protein n=1 Tax=Vigna mungo TaxID=3915 RepID=A0AAQ3NKL5_VIGMU
MLIIQFIRFKQAAAFPNIEFPHQSAKIFTHNSSRSIVTSTQMILPHKNNSKEDKKPNQHKQILQNVVFLPLHLAPSCLMIPPPATSVKAIKPKGITRSCPINSGILKAMEMNVEQ